MINKHILFVFICFALGSLDNNSFAQLIYLHNDNNYDINYRQKGDTISYTSMKPLLKQSNPNKYNNFFVSTWSPETNKHISFTKGNLLEFNDRELKLFLNPIIDLSGGVSSERKGTFLFTKGIQITGSAGKFQFGENIIESQQIFDKWIDSSIRHNGNVIPGQGQGRVYHNKGFDFSSNESYLSYLPSSHLNVILGYGKNFIGDGYRSLLLSDNSYNYPYLRVQASFRTFQYVALYSQYTNPRYTIGDTYQRKFSSIHYLIANINKHLQIGIFDAIVGISRDSNKIRGFDLQYLNPILFLHGVNFTEGSPDNSVLGLTVKHHIFSKSSIYGQIVIDDLNIQESLKKKQQHLNNKYGIQAGFWSQDLFAIKNTSLRIEFNTVRPFTYGHRNISLNYTNYNEALAHPLGANFHELVTQFGIRSKKLYFNFHNVFALIGRDNNNIPTGNNLWGGESGVPLFGSKTLDGIRTNFRYTQLTGGWTLNSSWRTNLELQIGNRKLENSQTHQSETFIHLGIVTNLSNHYYDF